MKDHVLRKIPVFSTAHLEAIGTVAHGLSIHHGIIVVWDEDYDTRVLRLLEERFPTGSRRPLAVAERKGSLALLWACEADAYDQEESYTVEDDYWGATHYYRREAGVSEAEAEPPLDIRP